MRPYRGKKIDNDKLVYGWLFERGGGSYIIPITDEYHTPASFVLTFVPVIPETVGQQTGLKDKNGKDLDWWENDIVKDTRRYIPKKERTYKIIFKQGSFWLKSIHGKLCLTCECLTPFLHIFNKIGTVHDKEAE